MLTVTSARPENIIIFGASGFNRQFVVEEAQSAEGPSGSLKCALAGQSRQWLEGVLNHASKSDAPYVLTEVAIFMADVSEADSWAIMCQQGLVVLNCVGLYGRVVLRSIVPGENATGPPQQSGVIGSCGFDSIPADMSILYTRDQFKKAERTLTAVCSSLPCREAVTWKSAIYGFAESGSLRKLRKKFDHQPLPIVGAKVKKRASLFFSKQIVQHAISFIGSDPWVVRRFQRFLYEEESTLRCNTTTNLDPLDLPVQYSVHMFCGSLLFWFLGKFEPGHVATPVAMVQTAFTILNEPQFLPINPGAAFARTTLINHLSRHGLVFSVKRF
uniref:Saccharopine dehydrogenase NADP binding domain-containing protein n=1 Tax=Oncorhynchus tshawytscha TaxID=74940 RepID=A0A8C8CA29_ONCTS